MADHGYLNAQHLEHLADRCERGATDLLHEADNAAEVLATRANGDRISPDDWAVQKRSAAAAATAYAGQLRQEAAALGLGRVSQERIAEAERVALASEMGGILIDGSASAERATYWGEDQRRLALDYQAEKVAATNGSGAFEHVAETIDGVEQVPFWRLSDSADIQTQQDRGDIKVATATDCGLSEDSFTDAAVDYSGPGGDLDLQGNVELTEADELGPEVSSEGEATWAGHPFYQHQGPIWADDSSTTPRADDVDDDADGI
jgi:hypothetical protein